MAASAHRPVSHSSPDSQRAREILRDLRGGDPLNEIVLVQSATATAKDPAFQKQVAAIVQDQSRSMPPDTSIPPPCPP